MSASPSNADLAAQYDAVAYAAQANSLSHPAHLATVATLLGLAPAAVEHCRVLEVGCSDGANLLPMAQTLPNATFVGVDISARAIGAARRTASEVGLSNIEFREEDLRGIAADAGSFDYIIAHGVYSWVPPPVRDALFGVASRHLSPNGVMFVSYNTYPGGHIRRAAWDILHFHVDHIEGIAARLGAARGLAHLLAEPGMTQEESDALLRGEFRRIAAQPDSALFHDDLAQVNDPVYFHEFVAHAERHGLAFLTEAKLSMATAAGLSPRVQQLVATQDRLAREQYLDFARFRRFRQSLVCRASAATAFAPAPERIGGMYASASTALVRGATEGRGLGGADTAPAGDAARLRALLEWLLAVAPRAVAAAEARDWWRDHGARDAGPTIEAVLLDACINGVVDLHVHPPGVAPGAGERPAASALARWQAREQDRVTNLKHETLTLKDKTVRECLFLLDGNRDRGALADALRPLFGDVDRTGARAQIDDYLAQFAKLALLVR